MQKKFKIDILEIKIHAKISRARQSNLFLKSFLIKSLSLTNIFNVILISTFSISSNAAILYPLKTSENQRSREIKG